MIEKLIGQIRSGFERLKDPREGKNRHYDFVDVCMAGYSVFHMQSPSILAHQERLNKIHGTHNGRTLFGFNEIPSDNQICNLLDQIDEKDTREIFDELHKNVNHKEFIAEDGLVVALDGGYFFSSSKISCACCLKRDHEGKTRHYHAMLVPALIHPDQKCALPLAPEFITAQDGAEKQDCELNSAKRWCSEKKDWLVENKVTLLGDDLFSRGPLIQQLLNLGSVRFIFVAKPTSHKYLQEWLDAYSPQDIKTHKTREKQGNKEHIFLYRFYHDVPLSGDIKSPDVNYFEMIVTDKKGKQLYYNTFVTNRSLTAQNIHRIAKMGRNRWKIENEAFNILKTKGYNLEHNFGHGKKHLANVLACFNLLAVLIHHLSETLCELYASVRACFGARTRFFQALAFSLSIQIFDSWHDFLTFVFTISKPQRLSRRSN